jgi:hypothetical protein
MPVRARSRVSSSSRKPSQLSWMARSSSSSASWPVAITPPSRTSAAGSSSSARPAARRSRRRLQVCAIVGQQRGAGAMQARELLAFSSAQRRPDQLARAHLAQRDAGGDALDVAGALELAAQALPGAFAQVLQRIEPLLRLVRRAWAPAAST